MLEITKKIEEIRDKIKPNIIYSHHFSDLNRDHRIVTESVLVAFRPLKKSIKLFYMKHHPVQNIIIKIALIQTITLISKKL